jgi:alpha-L-arabinofuranosidase
MRVLTTLLAVIILFALTENDSAAFYSDTTTSKACNVSVFAKDDQGIVNPLIMGFNIVYAYEPDVAWKDGKDNVPEKLKALKTKPLRYPGGTVTTFYHWNKLTGQGWADIWNPAFDSSKNAAPSKYMDLDEYLSLTRKLQTEPLVGVNMGSGQKYNRIDEGVQEAIQLMKYCISKGVRVKYYYLDNEPYQPDANFTFTAEQYAENVNRYASEMKKVDPNIKIIVNTHPNKDLWTKTLITNAGKNIDFVDVHMYWKFKNATFENWKKEAKMTHRGERPYSEQRSIFKKLFAEAGYLNIELMILEWNIGPNGPGNAPPTEAEAALMVAEQFTQFIQSGLYMSCFWPISTPSKTDWSNRTLLNAQQQHKPRKMYDMFTLFTDVLGNGKVKTTSTEERLITLAVKSSNGKEMWLYVLNKNLDKPFVEVELAISDFKASTYMAVGFEAADKSEGKLDIQKVAVVKKGNSHFTVSVPQFSLVKLTFKQ